MRSRANYTLTAFLAVLSRKNQFLYVLQRTNNLQCSARIYSLNPENSKLEFPTDKDGKRIEQ